MAAIIATTIAAKVPRVSPNRQPAAASPNERPAGQDKATRAHCSVCRLRSVRYSWLSPAPLALPFSSSLVATSRSPTTA